MTRRDRWTLAVAEAAILALTVLGWVLSYSALRRLAEAHGYAGWEANLWPLTVDLLAIASAMIAITLARRGHGPTGEAWAMAGLAAAATLAGNVLSAGGDLVAQGLHAWPAVCMLGAWHLFFRSVGEGRSPAGTAYSGSPDETAAAVHQLPDMATVAANGHGQGDDRNGQVRPDVAARISELLDDGQAVTGHVVASEFGVSARTGRRWLQQWCQARGVDLSS